MFLSFFGLGWKGVDADTATPAIYPCLTER
jgi:hypothetical protein